MPNLLLVIITLISVFVLALLVYTCVYRESKSKNLQKTTHTTVIGDFADSCSSSDLIVIAVPSFRLLYYMDDTKQTDMVIKVTGTSGIGIMNTLMKASRLTAT